MQNITSLRRPPRKSFGLAAHTWKHLNWQSTLWLSGWSGKSLLVSPPTAYALPARMIGKLGKRERSSLATEARRL
eukprot:4836892-Amphidinium_carterae.1